MSRSVAFRASLNAGSSFSLSWSCYMIELWAFALSPTPQLFYISVSYCSSFSEG